MVQNRIPLPAPGLKSFLAIGIAMVGVILCLPCTLAVWALLPVQTPTQIAIATTAPTSAPSSTWTPTPTPLPRAANTSTPTVTPFVPFSPTWTPWSRAWTPTRTPTPTPSIDAHFFDHFDGSRLDTGKWVLENTARTVSVAKSILELSSSADRYPYIHTAENPFPTTGDFRFSFRIRYAEVTACGTGIMMTSALPPTGMSQDQVAAWQMKSERSGVAAGLWQDTTSGMVVQYRSAADRADVPVGKRDTAWHTVSINYSSGQYRLIFDDRPVHTSDSTKYRPQSIWIGHPAELGASCDWDTLQLDYVRVD